MGVGAGTKPTSQFFPQTVRVLCVMIKPSSSLTLTDFMIYHHLFYIHNEFSLMLKKISEGGGGGEGGRNQLQVSPVITRWSGCTNPNRDIGEARSKFGADRSDFINDDICMRHTYIHVWRDL